MCEGINQGLIYIQSGKNYCPEYEISECPPNCKIRQKLLGAENILTISEPVKIKLKNHIIRNFDIECKKGK